MQPAYSESYSAEQRADAGFESGKFIRNIGKYGIYGGIFVVVLFFISVNFKENILIPAKVLPEHVCDK